MANHDDSDIKIFGGGKDAETDFVAIAEETMRHRSNGNVVKAKSLGAKLADFSPDDELLGEELQALISEKTVTLDLKLQIKVLLVFTAEYALYKLLPDILAAAASDSMYDRLRDESEGFYANICDGASFTFYYLAVRGESSIDTAMGESFAMLCDAEANSSVKKLGATVFSLALKRIGELVDEMNFE